MLDGSDGRRQSTSEGEGWEGREGTTHHTRQNKNNFPIDGETERAARNEARKHSDPSSYPPSPSLSPFLFIASLNGMAAGVCLLCWGNMEAVLTFIQGLAVDVDVDAPLISRACCCCMMRCCRRSLFPSAFFVPSFYLLRRKIALIWKWTGKLKCT